MGIVAGEAGDAFVHAHGGAVVAGADEGGGPGGVALVAEGLALVGAHSNGALGVEDVRDGQHFDADAGLRAAVKEADGGADDFFLARDGGFTDVAAEGLALAVYGVAGEAGDGGRVLQILTDQFPRTLG